MNTDVIVASTVGLSLLFVLFIINVGYLCNVILSAHNPKQQLVDEITTLVDELNESDLEIFNSFVQEFIQWRTLALRMRHHGCGCGR